MSRTTLSVSSYIKVFAGLCLLTLLTAAASFVHFGRYNTVVALVIAIVKALLVILFFMHVYRSRPLTRLFISAGISWLILLIGITFSDYITRDSKLDNENTWITKNPSHFQASSKVIQTESSNDIKD